MQPSESLPDDDGPVCTCTGPYPFGFAYSPDLDLWVHYHCNRPTRAYLDAEYARAMNQGMARR